MEKISVVQIIIILCEYCHAQDIRSLQAAHISQDLMSMYSHLYESCIETSMPSQKFITDDLQSYVNFPSKTTVGLARRYTGNRKFFANMIATTAFKETLAADVAAIRQAVLKKLKFCDSAIMDQEGLKEFYDRELDQSKI